MRNIIDSYRRPILAVFGVLLMIVFMMPSSMKSASDRNNQVIGHIGKNAVYAQENAGAEQDWEIVSRRIQVRTNDEKHPWIPLAAQILPSIRTMNGINPIAFSAIDQHKESFLLLLKEAEQRGVQLTGEEVSSILDSPMVGFVVDQGRIIAFSDIEDPDMADRYRMAVAHFLLVKNSYDLAANTIKISEPYRLQNIAEQRQTVNLSVVDVPTSQIKPAAPATQQLDEQFKKYADVNPEDTNKSPNGYGYRFPNRVKVQSIEIPMSEVRAAAERKRTANPAAQYDWDRDAYKYYAANGDQFATTQPTSGHATTRPFADVKLGARQAVLDNDATKLMQRILDRITNQTASDYVAYRNAITASGANAKIPASSVTAPYNSYDYLQRIAEETQKAFDVLPLISGRDKDYLTMRELEELPGLGRSVVEGVPFSSYVMSRAAAFTSERDEGKTIQNFEPSPVVRDDVGNAYVFRLSDAQVAHAPKSRQEVAAIVDADVRAENLYEQAKKDADQILEQAKKAGSLQAGVAAKGPSVITLSDVNFGDPTPLMPLHLGAPSAQQSFVRQIFDLMSSATKQNLHPMGIIGLPRDGRAMVVQITDIRSDVTPENRPILEMRAYAQSTQQLSMPLMEDWFSYDAIVARLKYQPNKEQNQSSTPANSSAPPAGQPLL